MPPLGDFSPLDFNNDFFIGYVEGVGDGELTLDGEASGSVGAARRRREILGGRIFLERVPRPINGYASGSIKFDGDARGRLGRHGAALAGLDLDGEAQAVVLNDFEEDEILLLLAVAA